MSRQGWIDDNRKWWDERAPIHAATDFYDLDGFRAGRDDLRPFEGRELGVDPDGLDLLHLQCHIGTDTLSWARRGARVVGLDFAPAAIDVARGLARDCDLEHEAEFVVANVQEAVAALGGRTFDVVYTGIGALCWLPELDDWAETCAALLRPGGTFYLVEIHPFLWPLGEDEPCVRHDYFAEVHDEDAGSYADRSAVTQHDLNHARNWGFGPVMSALISAGLVVEHVAEHDLGVVQQWPFMVRGGDGFWRTPADRPAMPLLWSLRARRPA